MNFIPIKYISLYGKSWQRDTIPYRQMIWLETPLKWFLQNCFTCLEDIFVKLELENLEVSAELSETNHEDMEAGTQKKKTLGISNWQLTFNKPTKKSTFTIWHLPI